MFEMLNDLDRKVHEEMRRHNDPTLIEAKTAVGEAIDLWDNFSKAETLENAYKRFVDAIRTKMYQAASGSPEEKIYSDVFDYAQEAMK